MNQKLSSADLEASQQAVARELEDAKAAHARAAYAYATNKGDDTRQALIQAKQRMSLLAAEQEGLAAALKVSNSIEAVQARQRRVDEVKAAQAEIEPTCERLEAAIGDMAKSAEILGDAFAEAVALVSRTLALQRKCVHPDRADHVYSLTAIRPEDIRQILGHLLFEAVGKLETGKIRSSNLNENYVLPSEHVAKMIQRLRQKSASLAAETVRAIESEAQATNESQAA